MGMLLTGIAISAGLGMAIGFGSSIYSDYSDDGEIFNGSIGWQTYVGRILGGGIAGAGLGAATVLGAAAGTAALVGSTATLFTTSGLSLSFGTALTLGTGSAFITGMAGYSVRTAFDPTEEYSLGNMFKEGTFNAISGALNVAGGYLGGISGLRPEYAQLPKNPVVYNMLIRPLLQNYFTFGIKIGLAILKSIF